MSTLEAFSHDPSVFPPSSSIVRKIFLSYNPFFNSIKKKNKKKKRKEKEKEKEKVNVHGNS
jgi:hypothetical protein